MKRAFNKIDKELQITGKRLCKKYLLPEVKKWLTKNKFQAIYFINGRGWVEKNEQTLFPTDIENLKVANELIELCNRIGYTMGYELPTTIKI